MRKGSGLPTELLPLDKIRGSPTFTEQVGGGGVNKGCPRLDLPYHTLSSKVLHYSQLSPLLHIC